MDKREFLDRLQAQLTGLTSEERLEAMEYYEEYFADAGEENEADVLLSLGSPEQVAEQIRAGLHKSEEGVFTENGYREKVESDNPPVVYGKKEKGRNTENGTQEGTAGHGGSSYAERNTGWNQNGYAHQNGGQGEGGCGNQNGEPYRGGYTGQNGGRNAYGYQNRQTGKKKSDLSGGMIVLLVVLGICASPIIIALGAAAVGIVVGILGAVFGVVVAAIAVIAALFAVGIALFIAGFPILIYNPFAGMACIALGCFMIALFLLLVIALVAVCGKFFPWLIREVEMFGKYMSGKWAERKKKREERA